MAMFDSYLFTNRGGRTSNEDSIGKRKLSDGELFILADGLGGHSKGEIASSCAVKRLEKAQEPKREESLCDWLKGSFEKANLDILELQKQTGSRMKSTLVALIVRNDTACWAHVGDSRLYHIRDNKLSYITQDHSVAYAKYKSGEITKAQIAKDDDQSSLIRVLGNSSRNQPDVTQSLDVPRYGDGFLLCSDGLWEYLNDEEIVIDFLKTDTAEEWAETLLLRAMERFLPENDNLSLITVRVTKGNR